MTTGISQFLEWFHSLSMDDKVWLLANPDSEFSVDAGARSSASRQLQGALGSYWIEAGPGPAALAAPGVALLEEEQLQLEHWWAGLAAVERDRPLGQRQSEPPTGYGLELTDLSAVERDRMVPVFLELKARQQV